MALTTKTGFAVDIINNANVSLLDLMHMPDISSQLIMKYPEQLKNDLLWLENLGAMEIATQEDYFVHEEDFLFPENVFIAGFSTAGLPSNQVRVTIASESHYLSGTETSIRFKDTVMFDNGLQGFVIEKNETVAGAHTILVQAINASKGNIQTAAPVGSRVSVIANADVEGGNGMRQSIMPQTTVITNQMQSFDEIVSVTNDEIGNKTWVKFDNYEGVAGDNRQTYITYAQVRAYQRMMAKVGRGLFLHEQNDANSLLDGKLVKTTRGLIPDMEDRSLEYYYITPDFKVLDDIETYGKRKYQSGDWNILLQNEFSQAFKSNEMTMFKDGGVVYGTQGAMSTATLGFTSYKHNVSGSLFNFKPLAILDDPSVTNQVGKKYVGMFLAIPASAVQSKGGALGSRLKIKYKPQVGDGARGNMKTWETGALAEKATSAVKELNIHYTAHQGLLATALDVCIIGKQL